MNLRKAMKVMKRVQTGPHLASPYDLAIYKRAMRMARRYARRLRREMRAAAQPPVAGKGGGQ